MVNFAWKRAKKVFVRCDFPGEPHCQHGATVKSALEANEERTTGVVAGKFNSSLDGFRTGISKKDFGWL